jgi:predicted TIM-barrel fold metal-dependent hydrolase
MQIVDAQIHLWGSGLPVNAAHRQVTCFDTAEVLAMMDEADVDAAVINPPGWDPGSGEMALNAVRDHPGRFAIMGHAHPDDPHSYAFLKDWTPGPELIGLRCLFRAIEHRKAFADGDYDGFWRAASDAGMPVALLAPDSLDAIADVAARYPDLRMTVDHLGGWGGFETQKDHSAMLRMPDVLRLARFANVSVKATGAPGYSGEAYPYPVMLDYCRQVFEAFGPERMFWGTDISKMPVSWTECIEMFTEHAEWLKGDDLELVMGGALCRAWNWTR